MREVARYLLVRNCFIALALVALLSAVFLPVLPAYAAPVITLTPSSGALGTVVTITGSVFDSFQGDEIKIFFDATEIETLVVPEGGAFSVDFTIPAETAVGPHDIVIRSATIQGLTIPGGSFTVEASALAIDIAEGRVGSIINITGSGFYVNKTVSLSYTNLSPEVFYTATASAAGKFSYQYIIPFGAAGSHKITASNEFGNRAEVDFNVLPQFNLNLNSAGPGDLVTAIGTGFARLSVIDIVLGSLYVASAQSDDVGSFEIDFYVPVVRPFAYDVRAQDILGNTSKTRFSVTAGASLSQDTGATGSDLTINGSGFTPGQTVTVYYDDTPVAVAVADNNGDFVATFTVPAGGGKHTITVSDGTTTKVYTFTPEKDSPTVPVLLLPENNSLTRAEAHFEWEDVTDVSVPVTYSLQIASDRNFSGVVFQKAGITDSQYTLSSNETLAADFKNTSYFWRAMAIDGAGNEGEWSESWVFYVSVPAAPALTLPANDARLKLPIRFGWQAVSSLSLPVTYHFQIAKDLDFTSPLLDEAGLTNPEYLISQDNNPKLKKGNTYYWRIKAIDNARHESDWSTAGSFYVTATSGFPSWGTYSLIGVGTVIIALLAFRVGRNTAFH